jgi:hypothetical protein
VLLLYVESLRSLRQFDASFPLSVAASSRTLLTNGCPESPVSQLINVCPTCVANHQFHVSYLIYHVLGPLLYHTGPFLKLNSQQYVHRAVPWLRRLVAGLSPRRPGFAAGSIHVRFLVDKVSLGLVSLRVHMFTPVNIIPPSLSKLTSSGG